MYVPVRFPAVLAFVSLATAPLFADTLLERWRYSETGTVPADAPEITVPHTWNAADIMAGKGRSNMAKDGYRRAPSRYATTLPATTPGKRVFLRFDGVSSVAEVFLNGVRIGGHEGCGTSFVFEITDRLRAGGENILEVKADNTWREDVGPLSGDFGVPGGIYRPVHVIEKPAVCLVPERGDYGVKVEQLAASEKTGELAVTAHVDSGGAAFSVLFELKDADGAVVASTVAEAGAGAPRRDVAAKLAVDSPHRWNGLADPYLYRLVVSVKSGDTTDTSSLDVGFRDIRITKDGFFLNGVRHPLRGVNWHQDLEGKSWAMTADDERRDVALIREIGANAVRCAHYPHSQVFLDACDRAGLLVWAEEPLIDTVGAKPEAFGDNLAAQLREMIAQQRHHASVFGWSLFNELGMRDKGGKDPAGVAKRMNDIAHTEDPSRPTLAATNNFRKDLNAIADVMAYNNYPGWYGGGTGDQTGSVRSWRANVPSKPWGIAEYGAGASLSTQDDTIAKPPAAAGRSHPEAWQSRVHEHALASIQKDDTIWGTFVWNMFDFASPWRHEGERDGINDKGLVTYDRGTRKDAFYLYKANWSSAPVLHLLARRDARRRTADTVIRYYSNLPGAVHVSLNGAAAGTAERYGPRAYIIRGVKLKPGKNRIEATGKDAAGGTLTDAIEWSLSPE